MTVSKDVYQESAAGQWLISPMAPASGSVTMRTATWSSWQTTDKGTYYFDLITGAMAKVQATLTVYLAHLTSTPVLLWTASG